MSASHKWRANRFHKITKIVIIKRVTRLISSLNEIYCTWGCVYIVRARRFTGSYKDFFIAAVKTFPFFFGWSLDLWLKGVHLLMNEALKKDWIIWMGKAGRAWDEAGFWFLVWGSDAKELLQNSFLRAQPEVVTYYRSWLSITGYY